jgi:hypothetical protein
MHGAFSGLAAANGDDDGEVVARGESGRAMVALRDNFAVTFDGNALAGVAELLDQAGDGKGFGKVAEFAIDLELEHLLILPSEIKCLSGDIGNFCLFPLLADHYDESYDD